MVALGTRAPLRLRSHRVFVPARRSLCRRQLCVVLAGEEREKLRQEIKQSIEALQNAAGELGRQLSELRVPRENMRLESELWSRQDALWKREMLRWEQERSLWDRKENMLLKYILSLPNATKETLVETSSGIPSSGAAASVKTPQQGAEVTFDGSIDKQQRSLLDEASQFLPGDESSFAPPAAAEFPSLGKEDHYDPSDPAVQNVRESLQAAFAAVNSSDVLAIDFSTRTPSTPAMNQESEDSSPENALPATGKAAADDRFGPPKLSIGADDIFWMSELHNALMQANFFPGEEDVEDWLFGDNTQSAVISYQASMGLPETGIVDNETWRVLLGPKYGSIRSPEEPSKSAVPRNSNVPASTLAALERSALCHETDILSHIRSMRETSELENRKRNNYAQQDSPSVVEELTSWPVLREGDGGRNVHYLQVALEQKGFIAEEEDQRWWYFGSSTHDCVVTFQACSSLPETGCVEMETWLALLEPDATPSTLLRLHNDFEDDMVVDTDAVWLLGEQRWEKRRKDVS